MLLPAFLRGETIIVPLKVDITYQGIRIVDTLCYDLYRPLLTPEEFAQQVCIDLNLSQAIQQRITLQIAEQLNGFKILVDIIKEYGETVPNWEKKIAALQPITIGIRHNGLDYSDRVDWNPMDETITPEEFARITCTDLGLPSEMELAIAHKIRESLFRWILNIMQNPEIEDPSIQPEFKHADTMVALVPTNQTVDMLSNLWKRAKPGNLHESSAIPHPMLPTNKDSNCSFWLKDVKL